MREYVRNKKEQLDEQATVRFETIPGLQGQMDWAFFEDHTVLEDGKLKKLYCFLFILGYSRTRYIEFVTDMSTNTLIRCHANAFQYFGGYPEEILYDNMKQVVIKRLLKQEDSTLNRQFEDFAGFYGFNPVLCRPYRGQTKGKVERTVQFVREISWWASSIAPWMTSTVRRWPGATRSTGKSTPQQMKFPSSD
ncbi:IS21 family transposase [Oscillibacter sp.]|uniref:IS21 family transposase n=1 Tax=Oscillibacter sp. TaxID=1945593 RepID=UPI00339092F0